MQGHGSFPGQERFHMPQENPCAAAPEITHPRACALQQEKPLQWEARTLQPKKAFMWMWRPAQPNNENKS